MSTTHPACPEPGEPCDVCALSALAAAGAAGVGAFGDEAFNRAALGLLRWGMLLLDREQERCQHAALLTIGCPHCGAHADAPCVTARGKPYRDTCHAARRRALADLTPTEADA